MPQKLDDYLRLATSDVVRARTRSTLTKPVRTSVGVETEAEMVERFVSAGNTTLMFHSMTGKKRDGLRLPLRPRWSIFSGDTGAGLTRTAALYANFLLGNTYDFPEIERRVTAEYERQIADAR